MKILFFGPQCKRLEEFLLGEGYLLSRVEDPVTLQDVFKLKPDYGISYRYRHIIRADIINYFSGNLINLHISLLPWNKGSDPNFWSFLDNTPKGVSIHKIDSGTDTGPILLQQELTFDHNSETLRTSYAKLSNAIENLFMENAAALLENKIVPMPQPAGGSYHRHVDMMPYMYMLEKLKWDTPVSDLKRPA